MLARRNAKSADLANAIGITPQNLSILKTGKAKAIRIATLSKICEYLDCEVSYILIYEKEE